MNATTHMVLRIPSGTWLWAPSDIVLAYYDYQPTYINRSEDMNGKVLE